MITIRAVAADDAVALGLWGEQQAELRVLYGEDDDVDFCVDRDRDAAHGIDPETVFASLVATDEDGESIATAMLQWPGPGLPPGAIELKRLYVREDRRRMGHSRVMMGAIEAAARRSGATSIVLETGTEQPAAIALYESLDYRRIAPYGQYAEDIRSICFAKNIATQVLVVNGTMGAGKTTTAAAVFDALGERGSRAGFIDGDYLCQAVPCPDGDPFNQELLFGNLSAVAPNCRDRGLGLMVIARVVEDPADRERYAAAFSSDAGPADVSIVRVDAPEEVRFARLAEREPEGQWRDWSLSRTVELADALEALDLDDAVVSTDDRARQDVASEVLAAAGWASPGELAPR